MDFTELIAYIKRAGRQALTFFPSKTDLVSVADADGNPTEETLAERLEKLATTGESEEIVIKKTVDVELKDIQDISVLECYNVGAIGICDQETYGDYYMHTTVTSLLKDAGTNGNGQQYTISEGTIIYAKNTLDSSEETAGYYKCIKGFTSNYGLDDIVFDYSLDSFKNLEFFEYLGTSSIGITIEMTIGTAINRLENRIDSFDSQMQEVQKGVNSYKMVPANLKDTAKVDSSAFLVSNISDTKKSLVFIANSIGKPVYVDSDINIASGLFYPNGGVHTFSLVAGYYIFNSTGVVTAIYDTGKIREEQGDYSYFGAYVLLKKESER